MVRLGFREAIGVKIAVAVVRDLVGSARGKCIDVDRLLWLLNEIEAYADRAIRTEVGIDALEMGRYIGVEVLEARKLLQVGVARE